MFFAVKEAYMHDGNPKIFEEITLFDLYAMLAWHALFSGGGFSFLDEKSMAEVARAAHRHAFFMLCERKVFLGKTKPSE